MLLSLSAKGGNLISCHSGRGVAYVDLLPDSLLFHLNIISPKKDRAKLRLVSGGVGVNLPQEFANHLPTNIAMVSIIVEHFLGDDI